MSERRGAFPDSMIKQAVAAGWITGAEEKNVNPGSFDVALSEDIFRVPGLPFPRPSETIRDLLSGIGASRYDYQYPLECGVTYLVRLREAFSLPKNVYAYANPKSSSGRICLKVRVLADGVEGYDTLPAGFKGEAWLSICPGGMPVRIAPGETLAQVRVCNADTRLDKTDLALALDSQQLLWNRDGRPVRSETIGDLDDSLILSINLHEDGWEGVDSGRILDLSRRDADPEDFFRIARRENGGTVRLRQNGFYVFRTDELVHVPANLACEMRPLDARFGEFRSHFAGFIDPGWGSRELPTLMGDGRGRSIVLEIIPHEEIILRHRQPVARIRFERMMEAPEVPYDDLGKSHYTDPKHLLSKHFKK